MSEAPPKPRAVPKIPSRPKISAGKSISKPSKSQKANATGQENRISNGHQHYKIGHELGRGSNAVVFTAVNIETGDFFAVKRFSLSGKKMDSDTLDSIEAEIELMKRLNHPNIVKYVDTIRESDFLYIILEIVDQGSLASMVKHFDFNMQESLVARYTVQILWGLQYLHEQGVIHRDIKAANILTTNDGQVKLADFGVARLSKNFGENGEADVAGSPYWMAPELISSETASSSCDIWSLGCTIMELLTGKPPYFDMQPFAAMYQIVQAQHPPFPGDISPELTDFLKLCFQHNPVERATASQLLSHPWLQPTIERLASQHANASSRNFAQLEKSQQNQQQANLSNKELASRSTKMASPRQEANSVDKDPSRMSDGNTTPSTSRRSSTSNVTSKLPSHLSPAGRPMIRRSASLPSLPTATLTAADDDSATSLSNTMRPSTGAIPLVDLTNMTASPSLQYPSPRREMPLSSRSEDSGLSAVSMLALQMNNVAINADDKSIELYTNTVLNSSSSGMDDYEFSVDPSEQSGFSPSTSMRLPMVRMALNEQSSMDLMDNDQSHADISFSGDEIGNNNHFISHSNQSNSNPLQLAIASSALNPSDSSDSIQTKDFDARRAQEIARLMNKIRPGIDASDNLNMCSQLFAMFESIQQRQLELFTANIGVMPIVEMLEAHATTNSNYLASHESEVIRHVIRIVNRLVENNSKLQEQLALMGIVPIMMRIFTLSTASPKSALVSNNVAASTSSNNSGTAYDSRRFKVNIVNPIVLEVSKFIHMLTLTSAVSEQMLIGSGGLPIFVSMIGYSSMLQKKAQQQQQVSVKSHEPIYIDVLQSAPPTPIHANVAMSTSSHLSSSTKSPIALQASALTDPNWTKTLEHTATTDEVLMVCMGIDCVDRILQSHVNRTKDLCRSLIKIGIVSHLSIALRHFFGQFLSLSVSPEVHAHFLSHKTSFSMKGMDLNDPKTSARLDTMVNSNSNCNSTTPAPAAGDSPKMTSTNNNNNSNCNTPNQQGNFASASTSSHATSSTGTSNSFATNTIDYKYTEIIANLFLVFATSDSNAAEKMAQCVDFISVMVSIFQCPLFRSSSSSAITIGGQRSKNGPHLSQSLLDIVDILLDTIRRITAEPLALAKLENSGILVCLVHLLNGPLHKSSELVLQSIFNLCRLNRSRQERAAMHGIIPHLKRLIEEGSQFQQLALPIVLDLAHTSNATRVELWKHDMVSFYVKLLKDPFCQSSALNALAVWLFHATEDVEKVLVEPKNLCSLIVYFCSSTTESIRSLHKPFLDMMMKSRLLCCSLSKSGPFVAGIVKRLQLAEAIVLRSLLNMLQLLHQSHPSPRQLVLDFDLYCTVRTFALSENRVLVNQIALKLLSDFQVSTLS